MAKNRISLFFSSNYTINVNESQNAIEIISDESITKEYDHLKNIPVRDHNDFYTLEDLNLANYEEISTKDVNLLFVIREVGSIEQIKNKNGQMLAKLELTVFDNTQDAFKLTM
jgi:hypothetical protein